MKYFIVKQQKAEGCKNSIDCGIAIEWFETDPQDPRSEQKQIEDHVAYPDGENEWSAVDPSRHLHLAKAWAIPAQHVQKIDIARLQAIHCGHEEDRKKAETEAAERAELIRLQKKYGSSQAEKTEWTGEPHPEVGRL